MSIDTIKHVAISRNDGGYMTFNARKGPWTWREFVCFLKEGAADDEVTYIPVVNIDEIEVS